jgi:homoserine O-acetyltransferase
MNAQEPMNLVTPQVYHSVAPLHLACGQELAQYQLVYETYGTLNADKSNAILVCHALTANHHSADYHTHADKKPGWWHPFIGKHKPIDTNKFFVVSLNNLGGCHGSTGPTSINPDTGTAYAANFPIITVSVWVNSQQQLAEHLGIDVWHGVIGGSLGGMQALQWSISYPDKIKHALVIAAAAKLSAQNIAFNEIARQAIMSDSNFYQGDYATHNCFPQQGLTLARMLGHITYLSEDAMRTKFGRELRSGKLSFTYDTDFQIESYLRRQGHNFSSTFDANSYLLMTKALDYFDPARDYDNNLTSCLSAAKAKFCVISFSSDWRFPPIRSQEIVQALISARKQVNYINIQSDKGHDGFLLPIEQYQTALATYLHNSEHE